MTGQTTTTSLVQARSLETRRAILRTAASRFAEHGIGATSMRKIAEDSGVSPGAIYHHFASKEVLARAMMGEFWTELTDSYQRAASQHGPLEALTGMMTVLFDRVETHAPQFIVMNDSWRELNEYESVRKVLHDGHERSRALFMEVLDRCKSNDSLRTDIDSYIAYRTIVGAIVWVARWYRPSGEQSLADIKEAQMSVLIRGLGGH